MELASGLRNRVSNLVNFPLEEEEGDEELLPLLEELDIDFGDMIKKIRIVLLPIRVDKSVLSESPDFWGPMLVVLMYGLLIVWGQFQAVSWVFTIWLIGSLFVFLLARVLGGEVTYSQSVGVVGYSLLPIVITTFALLFLKVFPYASLIIPILGVLWSTVSAGTLLVDEGTNRKKVLVMYPILLLYIYFSSLASGF